MACCVQEQPSRVTSTASCADDDSCFIIQEDASLPASLVGSSASATGCDSDDAAEDALEAFIQTELSKFQQQQAARYAELLACGQAAVLPLASPAPRQQLLRAHQNQQLQALQETPLPLSDGGRVEYLPSGEASTLEPTPSSAACRAEGSASSSALPLSARSSQHAVQPEDAVADTAAAGGLQQALAGDGSSSCLDDTGSAGSSSSHRLTAATVEVDDAPGPLQPEGSISAQAATGTALACAVSGASSPPAVCQGGGGQDPASSSEDPESFIYQDEGGDGAADTPRFCSNAVGGSARGSSSSAGAAGDSPSPAHAAVTVAAGFSVSLAGSPAAGSSAARLAAAGPDFLEGELGPWSSEDAVLSAPAGGARNSSSGGARAARPLSAHGPRAGRSCGRQHDSVTHHQQQQQPRCQQVLAQHSPHTRPSSAPAQTHLRGWLASRGAPQQHQLGVVSESSQEGLSLLRSSDGSSSSRSQAQPQQHFAVGWSGRPSSAAPAMPSPASGCSRGQRKWDDSPLPLCIPKWVPMAEAVQAGSPVAAGAAPGGVVTAGSSGRWDALGSSVGDSRRGAASAADSLASSRPQTAGARMQQQQQQQQQQQRGALHHASMWGPAAALLPSRPGSSSSKSMQPCCWYCGGRAASGTCSCRGPGPSRPATAGAGLHVLNGGGAAAEGAGDGNSTTSVSAYLSDMLQQVRQANACCRQLGLLKLKQFRLAAAQAGAARPSSSSSSKRPEPRQPSQVVELWEVGSSSSSSSSTAGRAGSPERGPQHSAPAGAPADATWHLRRRLTLQQFAQHLARLKSYAATAAAAAMSTGAARASGCYLIRPASTGRRARSPTRPRQHGLTRRSSSARAAAGSQMLLVLSPRGAAGSRSGGAGSGCVLRSVMSPPASRPASAPRACSSSRPSPRRERGCEP